MDRKRQEGVFIIEGGGSQAVLDALLETLSVTFSSTDDGQTYSAVLMGATTLSLRPLPTNENGERFLLTYRCNPPTLGQSTPGDFFPCADLPEVLKIGLKASGLILRRVREPG